MDPTSFPTSFPTQSPTASFYSGPTETLIIFLSTLFGVYLSIVIYICLGHDKYVDELKGKLYKIYLSRKKKGLEGLSKDNSYNTFSEKDRLLNDFDDDSVSTAAPRAFLEPSEDRAIL